MKVFAIKPKAGKLICEDYISSWSSYDKRYIPLTKCFLIFPNRGRAYKWINQWHNPGSFKVVEMEIKN